MTNGKTLKILAAVLLLSIFSVKGFAGYLDNSHNRFYPAISDEYIVWEDDRRGNIDIFHEKPRRWKGCIGSLLVLV